MKHVFLALALSLTACASMAQKKFADRYLDHSVDTAIMELGQPARITEITTGKVYEWDRNGGASVHADSYRYTAGFSTANANVTESRCTIRMSTDSLAVVNGVIFEGNACN